MTVFHINLIAWQLNRKRKAREAERSLREDFSFTFRESHPQKYDSKLSRKNWHKKLYCEK